MKETIVAIFIGLMMIAGVAHADTPVVGAVSVWYETIHPQDILPRVTGTYDLGSSSYKWAEGYINKLIVDAGTAAAPSVAYGTTGMYWPDANTVGWSISGTEKVRIDLNGNLGVKVVPVTTWHSGKSVVQIGGLGSIYAETAASAGNQMSTSCNAYYDGAWKHIINDESTGFWLYNGNIYFVGATAGVAGSAISWENLAQFKLNDGCYLGFDNAWKFWTTTNSWTSVAATSADTLSNGQYCIHFDGSQNMIVTMKVSDSTYTYTIAHD